MKKVASLVLLACVGLAVTAPDAEARWDRSHRHGDTNVAAGSAGFAAAAVLAAPSRPADVDPNDGYAASMDPPLYDPPRPRYEYTQFYYERPRPRRYRRSFEERPAYVRPRRFYREDYDYRRRQVYRERYRDRSRRIYRDPYAGLPRPVYRRFPGDVPRLTPY
jgi:hypothetical protein